MPVTEIYLNKMEHDYDDSMNIRSEIVRRVVNAKLRASLSGDQQQIVISHFHWLSLAKPDDIKKSWQEDERRAQEKENNL